MKSVVFVIESLRLGGAEKSLVTLLNNIDYQRYAIDLILFNKGGIFENDIPKQVNVIYIPMCRLSFLERVKFKLVKQFNFNKLHTSQLFWPIIKSKFEKVNKKYDISIAYNQGFATYYVERYITSSLKFAWLNIDYQKAGYQIDFDYPIYENFDSIVAVSKEARNGIVAELKKISAVLRVEIIKDISDQVEIKRQSQKPKLFFFDNKKINIVTVCRLAKQKGLYLAVESCKLLIEKGYPVHWYLIGEGEERQSIEELISKNKLANHFTLVGMTDNPYPYMADCDIYVQTSLYEGLGLTIVEASYLKKPIVSTNFPTIYGILKDRETVLVANMNSKSISEKIEELINNNSLKNRLIANLTKSKNSDKEYTLIHFENLISQIDNNQ